MTTRRSEEVELEMYDTRSRRVVSVSGVQSISPSLIRITLSGQAIQNLPHFGPTGWAKIFLSPTEGDESPGRAYTLRNFNRERGEVDIDVVLHEAGPLTSWSRTAIVGEQVSLAGPRGGFEFNTAAKWMVLAGDLSALPAIASIVEASPPHVHLEVALAIDQAEDLALLPRRAMNGCRWTTEGDTALLALVEATNLPTGFGEVWAAGEAAFVRDVRHHFISERCFDKRNVHCAGYWKRDAPDHRDTVVG